MSDSPSVRTNAASTSQNAPIFRLFSDILWYIFYINATMTPKTETTLPVFETLLHSSHVCSSWRQTINSSSSLWAQVINVKFLWNRITREEIMRRTGDALLSITAEDHFTHSQQLLTLLEENWHRIRYLSFSIEKRSAWQSIEAGFWRLLERPAKYLETCIFNVQVLLQVDDEWIPPVAPDGHILFNDQAPALRTFVAPTTISLAAPWLTHLVDISLHGPLPVDQFLQALSSMPFLEILRDGNSSITRSPISSPLPKITMPSVKRIDISSPDNIQPYLDFLTHISPLAPSKCRLNFSVYPGQHRTWRLEDWDIATEILRLFPDFCGLSEAPSLELGIHRGKFGVTAHLPSYGTSSFEIMSVGDPSLVSQDHMQGFFPKLMQSFTFRNLHYLLFLVSPGPSLSTFDQNSFDHLSSVQVLETSVYSIQCLTDFLASPPETAPVMFPALQTLQVNSCPEKVDIPSIKLFLASRTTMGKPLQTLIIKMISYRLNKKARTVDMRWLDQFTGLKVIFLHLRGGGQPVVRAT
ncbi:hypothetical protein CPB84DRAFT_1843790 [Gymnopilus junonius]|uniref:F-box domain-containing protein n=1 Tax=Gymnopilus junonius TaxID=109634 RepID=A0A9P5TR51_GYMJU|nr:hypothetical protein CPB84DRAFT_1843790 [Gymnopilus junonius]